MGDDHQTPGETEPVAGAGDRPLVSQVLGDFFEPAPDESVERLQEEKSFTEAVDQLPHRVSAREVSQLVREEALLMLGRQIGNPLRTADLGPPEAGREGHRDGSRSAQANGASKAHGGGQTIEQSSRRSETASLQQPSEVEDRTTESEQGQQGTENPEGQQCDGPGGFALDPGVGRNRRCKVSKGGIFGGDFGHCDFFRYREAVEGQRAADRFDAEADLQGGGDQPTDQRRPEEHLLQREPATGKGA
jgi:hypothetical protein